MKSSWIFTQASLKDFIMNTFPKYIQEQYDEYKEDIHGLEVKCSKNGLVKIAVEFGDTTGD